MNENKVYLTPPDFTKVDLKKNMFFFEGMIFSPMIFQTPIFRVNNIEPIHAIELFKRNILNINIDPNELEEFIEYKLLYELDEGLKNYLITNSKKVCVFSKISEEEQKIVDDLSKKEYTDKNKTEQLKRMRLNIFRNDLINIMGETYSNLPSSIMSKLPSPEFIRKTNEKIVDDHLAKQEFPFKYGYFYRDMIEQTKFASLLYTDKFTAYFLSSRFANKNLNAQDFIEIYDEVLNLDFIDMPKIDGLSIEEILEIRNSKYWSGAMKELMLLINNFKIGKDKSINITQAKEDIKDRFYNSIEELDFKKSLILSSKNLLSHFTLGKIPLVGDLMSANDALTPIKQYFKKKKQNNLMYFLKEMRSAPI